VKTANDGRGKTQYVARIIAFFLLAGGVLGLLGLLGSLLTVYHSAHQHQVLGGMSGLLSTAVFASCIPAGAALWRATPNV
jgi:hypothetical protein